MGRNAPRKDRFASVVPIRKDFAVEKPTPLEIRTLFEAFRVFR
jgi:hypothetical protein